MIPVAVIGLVLCTRVWNARAQPAASPGSVTVSAGGGGGFAGVLVPAHRHHALGAARGGAPLRA